MTDSLLGSAFVGVLATSGLGVLLTLLATEVLGTYGFALFVGTPFALGFFSAVFHGLGRRRGQSESIAAGSIAVALASVALMAVAVEGAICIVMALPLTLGLGVLGALTGHAASRHLADGRAALQAISVVAFLPVLMSAEAAVDPTAPLRSVTTEVVIDAPPSVVWHNVVAVEPLPEPGELVFRLGIAFPTGATIDGSGVGAVRRCTFSTGDFVEPITVWEPGRRLAFSVRAQPPPLRELSPWANVEPPHLEGFLRSERGEFELVPLAGGRTLLRGTSWYRNRMWPQSYWGLWADGLMRRIHLRVLRHVKAQSEAG